MSEATHTNGPWEVLGRQIYDVSDPFPIASITGVKRPPEERDANGWLIAAAPELREIAEYVANEKRPQFEMPLELLVMVRDVLRKVKGETR